MSTPLIPVSSVFLLGLCATYFRPLFYIECQPTCRPCFIPQNYSSTFCFTYFLTCHPRIMLIIYGLFARFSFVLTMCALSFVHAFRYRVPSLSMFHVCRMRPLFSRYFVFSFTYSLASVIVFPLAKPRFNTEKLLTLCSCFFYTECSEENVSNFRISSHKSYSKEVLYRRMLVYPCTHQ